MSSLEDFEMKLNKVCALAVFDNSGSLRVFVAFVFWFGFTVFGLCWSSVVIA